MTCVERKFEFQDRKCKWEEYKGTRYSDGDSTPTLVNSSELRTADFPLTEVRPLQLDTVSRGDRRTRGAVVRSFRVWVTVRLYSTWKTTMNLGQDVSEFLVICFKFFEKKN